MKFLKDGHVSEYDIQCMIVDYINWIGYKHCVIQIYNEGAGQAKRGRKAYKSGLRVGASDLFIAVPRHGKHGFWMEVKSKNGVLRPTQLKFFEDMEKQGYYTAAVWSFEEAKEHLDWYLLENRNSKIP